MDAPATQFAPAAGGDRIAFQVLGKGPAIAMLFPYHVNHLTLNWRVPLHRSAMQFMARHGTVINLDFPGAGLSPSKRKLSLVSMTNALEAVREAAGIDRLAVCAMGAAALVACDYAVRYRHRVSRMVLVAGGRSDANRELLQLRRRAPQVEAELRGAMLGGIGDRRNAQALALVAKEALNGPASAQWESLLGRTDLLALAGKVTTPVLYFHAASDQLVPLTAAQALVVRFPDAKLNVVSGRSGMDIWRNRVAVSEAARFLTAGSGTERPTPRSRRCPPAIGAAAGLSHREADVIALVAKGRTNRQIAEELFISLNTVSFHLRNIFAKTGAANRTEAVALLKLHV
jgi:DNA-binding CsgD family transcriptional regulator/pimeloyl-ACP methyl ester carboxylesterase